MKTIKVPWTGKHSRFTLMFEAVAIKVLQAASSIKRAAELLSLSWDALHAIIERAVGRGHERRKLEGVHHVGVDEKSFGRGQDYISLMNPIKKIARMLKNHLDGPLSYFRHRVGMLP